MLSFDPHLHNTLTSILVAVLVLLSTLVCCIVRHRRATAASEKEYNVEASQVEGPPTIIATEYNPASGHVDGRFSPQPGQMSGPMMPATVYHQNWHSHPSINQTAPVTQSSFQNQPYPFTGYSSVRNLLVPRNEVMLNVFAGECTQDRVRQRRVPETSSSWRQTQRQNQGASCVRVITN